MNAGTIIQGLCNWLGSGEFADRVELDWVGEKLNQAIINHLDGAGTEDRQWLLEFTVGLLFSEFSVDSEKIRHQIRQWLAEGPVTIINWRYYASEWGPLSGWEEMEEPLHHSFELRAVSGEWVYIETHGRYHRPEFDDIWARFLAWCEYEPDFALRSIMANHAGQVHYNEIYSGDWWNPIERFTDVAELELIDWYPEFRNPAYFNHKFLTELAAYRYTARREPGSQGATLNCINDHVFRNMGNRTFWTHNQHLGV